MSLFFPVLCNDSHIFLCLIYFFLNYTNNNNGIKKLTYDNKERPKPSLHPFGPMVTLTIGLALVLVIGTCAIVLIVRCACGGGGRNGNNNKRKEFVRAHGGTTVRTASPGPSDKSATSKEIDGNESDEKNPDVIPDTIESDEQVHYIKLSLFFSSTNFLN